MIVPSGLRTAFQIKQPEQLDYTAWRTVVFQMTVLIRAAGAGYWLDTFNTIYHLHRGLGIAAFLVASLAGMERQWPQFWGLIVVGILMFYRGERFSRQYARELWAQFIRLTTQPESGALDAAKKSHVID